MDNKRKNEYIRFLMNDQFYDSVVEFQNSVVLYKIILSCSHKRYLKYSLYPKICSKIKTISRSILDTTAPPAPCKRLYIILATRV